MADIIPPGYGQVFLPIRHSALARSAAVTWGVDMNGQGGSVSLCAKIQTDFTAAFAAAMANECTIGPARLEVGQDGGENLVFVSSVTVAGTSSAEKIPANSALLLTKNTTRGGRRGKGRMYLPWVMTEADVNEVGVLTGASITARQTEANTFLENLTEDAGANLATPMVLLHSTGESAPGLPNAVTSLTVSGLIGSQRRRLGR